MGIEKIKELKQGIEQNILEILRKFEEDTGVSVSEVELNKCGVIGGNPLFFVASVSVHIDL